MSRQSQKFNGSFTVNCNIWLERSVHKFLKTFYEFSFLGSLSEPENMFGANINPGYFLKAYIFFFLNKSLKI